MSLPQSSKVSAPWDAAARSANDIAFSVDEPSRVVPPSPTIYGLNMGQGLRKVAPQYKKLTLKIIIVYYYYPNLQITSSGVIPPRHGDARDDIAFFTIGDQAYCLAGDRHQCPGRKRIFDRWTCQPEVDTAGGLRPDRSLIHICDVRRSPYHSARRCRFDCDLQTFGNSLAGIGYIGRCHTIAGCGGRVVPA